jgi:hypothetical protein
MEMLLDLLHKNVDKTKVIIEFCFIIFLWYSDEVLTMKCLVFLRKIWHLAGPQRARLISFDSFQNVFFSRSHISSFFLDLFLKSLWIWTHSGQNCKIQSEFSHTCEDNSHCQRFHPLSCFKTMSVFLIDRFLCNLLNRHKATTWSYS